MVQHIIAISGIHGSGKTTLAKMFLQLANPGSGMAEYSPMADQVRHVAMAEYEDAIAMHGTDPTLTDADWFDRTQEGKNKPRAELGGRSIREVINETTAKHMKDDPLYWVKRWARRYSAPSGEYGQPLTVIADDLVHIQALRHLRKVFGERLLHIHCDGTGPTEFDSDLLRKEANLVIGRGQALGPGWMR